MAAYGDTGSMGSYEYDHLVSLELGGAPNDTRNLWPEPGGSPNRKDSVEDRLHREVCDGQMMLAVAQHIIATDWVGWAERNGMATSGRSRPAPTPSSAAASPPPSPPASTSSLPVVHPGAFCAPAGGHGVTDAGTAMTCKPSATDSRNRWRRS